MTLLKEVYQVQELIYITYFVQHSFNMNKVSTLIIWSIHAFEEDSTSRMYEAEDKKIEAPPTVLTAWAPRFSTNETYFKFKRIWLQ